MIFKLWIKLKCQHWLVVPFPFVNTLVQCLKKGKHPWIPVSIIWRKWVQKVCCVGKPDFMFDVRRCILTTIATMPKYLVRLKRKKKFLILLTYDLTLSKNILLHNCSISSSKHLLHSSVTTVDIYSIYRSTQETGWLQSSNFSKCRWTLMEQQQMAIENM